MESLTPPSPDRTPRNALDSSYAGSDGTLAAYCDVRINRRRLQIILNCALARSPSIAYGA